MAGDFEYRQIGVVYVRNNESRGLEPSIYAPPRSQLQHQQQRDGAQPVVIENFEYQPGMISQILSAISITDENRLP